MIDIGTVSGIKEPTRAELLPLVFLRCRWLRHLRLRKAKEGNSARVGPLTPLTVPMSLKGRQRRRTTSPSGSGLIRARGSDAFDGFAASRRSARRVAAPDWARTGPQVAGALPGHRSGHRLGHQWLGLLLVTGLLSQPPHPCQRGGVSSAWPPADTPLGSLAIPRRLSHLSELQECEAVTGRRALSVRALSCLNVVRLLL